MQTPRRTLAMNGKGEFFVHTYYYDGSVGCDGPYATGEEAAAVACMEAEDQAEWDRWADNEAATGPEFPNGEFPTPVLVVRIADGYVMTLDNPNGQPFMTECETVSQGLAELAAVAGVEVSSLYASFAE